jgi:hypothetical protein
LLSINIPCSIHGPAETFTYTGDGWNRVHLYKDIRVAAGERETVRGLSVHVYTSGAIYLTTARGIVDLCFFSRLFCWGGGGEKKMSTSLYCTMPCACSQEDDGECAIDRRPRRERRACILRCFSLMLFFCFFCFLYTDASSSSTTQHPGDFIQFPL